MKRLTRLSVLDQTIAYLREGVREKRWGKELPGVLRLAQELHVSKDAVRAALQQLESEGLLLSAGHGKKRRVSPEATKKGRNAPLLVAILIHDPLEEENGNYLASLFQLQHDLVEAGHHCVFAPKSQKALGFDVPRIARMVTAVAADAWVICSGSRELNEWFSRQKTPAIAVGGHRPETMTRVAAGGSPTMQAAVQHLTMLGHRRIVLICPQEWRLPQLGVVAITFLEELAAQTHTAASPQYSVPDWEQTADGFHVLLEQLFRITAPTALIVVEPMQAVAVQSFLAQRGLRVPRDLSLVVVVKDASLQWCRPHLAHFQYTDIFHLVVRWVAQVVRGSMNPRDIVVPEDFVPGESIAPPKKG